MITTTSLQDDYGQTKSWQNELDFYEVEIRVLHQLLDKYIEGIHTPSQIEQLSGLLNDLFEWSAADKALADTLKAQTSCLAGMLTDDATFADDRSKYNQEKLGKQMDDFRFEYRQLKAEIYHLVSSLSAEAKAN